MVKFKGKAVIVSVNYDLYHETKIWLRIIGEIKSEQETSLTKLISSTKLLNVQIDDGEQQVDGRLVGNMKGR